MFRVYHRAYGLSSYGYDLRVADAFKIFTNHVALCKSGHWGIL
jgi:deoxycytidine triphosphate deaminase